MTVTASLPATPARPVPSGIRRPGGCTRALRKAAAMLAVLGLLLSAATARADEGAGWTELDTGLQLGIFPAPDAPDGPERIVALRIDPAYYEFSLHTTSEEGEPALSLAEWARRHDLNAVINASMYLPDARTSTGYLRNGAHLNNPRIGGNLGAFFVFGPLSPDLPQADLPQADLPQADLLDRTVDPWETLLPQYRGVVQNYRLIGANRRILWPRGGPLYSVAAVGQDGSGAILFLHCREPLTAWRFATILLALPIDIRDVMYVEGGPQAGLYLRTPVRTDIWMGRHMADFWSGGNAAAPLPNVLGARRKATPPQPGLFPDGRERPMPQF